jgi:hypothetical protein
MEADYFYSYGIDDNTVSYEKDSYQDHGGNSQHESGLQHDKRYNCQLKCEGNKTYNQPGNCPDCNLKMVIVVEEHLHH